MVTLKILGSKGHEELTDLTPEEARQLIEKTEEVGKGRYFIVDKATNTIMKELTIQDDQELLMIPHIQGGST